MQWCLLYLTDADAVALLRRCTAALRAGGAVVVKENICRSGFVVDKDDNSLTRSNAYMLRLFDDAGVRLLYNVKQKGFPKQLYEVRMYVVVAAGGGGGGGGAAAADDAGGGEAGEQQQQAG